MKNELVFFPNNINGEPFTYSDIIAENTNISHHAAKQLIVKYENDLSELGTVALEIQACPHKTGAAVEKIYRLNEQQATLLITYMRNTEIVRKFKKALVKEFYAIKKELTERRFNRSMLKHTHKDLADAIKLIPPHPHSSRDYSNYNNLAYIIAFGCSSSKLKKQRNVPSKADTADYLTAAELETLQDIKDKICTCIEIGMNYDEIKDRLMQMHIRKITSKEC